MATFVDLFLTPIAGGVGGAIGYSMMLRKNPALTPSALGKTGAITIVGVGIAAVLLALKFL
ncbi:hypothetical protein [Pseudophaeobacter sp.]|uniref:hypothetical protein n=1 Tax=Pseudophaeobacter sp. TaxID=1971739 RepID=UPI004058B94E